MTQGIQNRLAQGEPHGWLYFWLFGFWGKVAESGNILAFWLWGKSGGKWEYFAAQADQDGDLVRRTG